MPRIWVALVVLPLLLSGCTTPTGSNSDMAEEAETEGDSLGVLKMSWTNTGGAPTWIWIRLIENDTILFEESIFALPEESISREHQLSSDKLYLVSGGVRGEPTSTAPEEFTSYGFPAGRCGPDDALYTFVGQSILTNDGLFEGENDLICDGSD